MTLQFRRCKENSGLTGLESGCQQDWLLLRLEGGPFPAFSSFESLAFLSEVARGEGVFQAEGPGQSEQ